MKRRRIIVLCGIVLLIFIVTALAGYTRHKDRYHMVNVGGDTNRCECSKRLER